MEVGTMRKTIGRRKTIGTLAALAVAAAAIFVTLPVSSASAGSNGQQVIYCTPDNVTTVKIVGTNQNGVESTLIKPVDYPGVCDPLGSDRNVSWKWWWKGTIDIFYSFHNGVDWTVHYHKCDIPVEQDHSDLYYC
jgi:hypothetical protein